MARDNIPKKLYLRLVEVTFLELSIQTDTAKLVKDQSNMLLRLLYILGINQNVVKITNNKVLEKFSKNIVHQVLKDCWCVCKSKRHDKVFKVAIPCLKSGLSFISFFNSY